MACLFFFFSNLLLCDGSLTGGADEDETEKSHFQITPPRNYSKSQHGFCKQTAEFIY